MFESLRSLSELVEYASLTRGFDGFSKALSTMPVPSDASYMSHRGIEQFMYTREALAETSQPHDGFLYR